MDGFRSCCNIWLEISHRFEKYGQLREKYGILVTTLPTQQAIGPLFPRPAEVVPAWIDDWFSRFGTAPIPKRSRATHQTNRKADLSGWRSIFACFWCATCIPRCTYRAIEANHCNHHNDKPYFVRCGLLLPLGSFGESSIRSTTPHETQPGAESRASRKPHRDITHRRRTIPWILRKPFKMDWVEVAQPFLGLKEEGFFDYIEADPRFEADPELASRALLSHVYTARNLFHRPQLTWAYRVENQ